MQRFANLSTFTHLLDVNQSVRPAQSSSGTEESVSNHTPSALNTFIGTEELVYKHLPSAVEGVRADGQRYWLTDGNIIFDAKKKHKVDSIRYSKETSEGELICFNLIDPDEHFEILTQGLYKMPVNEDDSSLRYIYNQTELAKVEAQEKKNARDKLLIEALVTIGVEVNEDSVRLLEEVQSFDYDYDHSDDITVWRRWSDKEKKLDKELEAYPLLAELKRQHYND